MPDRFWSLVTVTAFWGWVLSTLSFILQAFGGQGEFRKSRALWRGVTVLMCFALWIAAMRRA